jgi:hypothetical protein
MTEPHSDPTSDDDTLPPDADLDADPMRDLLRRSMSPAAEAPPPPMLEQVQRKLRTRSRGKFFADGWSTSESRLDHALVALVMLVFVGLAYFALGPTGISR